MYLLQQDFNKAIQSDSLNQIIGGDSSLLSAAIAAATEEVKGYLVQKYDLSWELRDVLTYDAAVSYKAGQRVRDTAGVLYQCNYPYQIFSFTGIYAVGDQVFWNNKTYTCVTATPVLTHSGALQYRTYENLPAAIAPDDPVNGKTNWGTGTAYSVTAGTALTNTTFFTLGDTRSQMLVMFLVDVALYHLHSRIAPRNIPDLRVKRYDDVRSQLKAYSKGDLTAAFPEIAPRQGARIRWGGNFKQINSY